ncbi:MAG: CBS domain-containing protein [Hydrococcus sp. Prado102]|jgi:CBS domain-containing protein|nr:CBS domain-containing protein [Hydrococcus sp. Prado102]
MKAAAVMTNNVVTICDSATVAEAAKLMKGKGLKALIVTPNDEGDAYGIVTETDIAYKIVAFGQDPERVRVNEIMTKPCIVVNPNLDVEYVVQLFARTGIRIAPVIQGKLLGIVSINDILNKSNFVEQLQYLLLEKIIRDAIANARDICAKKGIKSSECAVAWDLVEELQAEAARQKVAKLPQTAFEEYGQEYPEAMEAGILEQWCSG